ncbi:hypothetical protein [Streptomyces sp. Root1310]|uniref:hypothetical protein n=1 Tax=unclassified Streptomyces TaxID=2593676 RepID=UPI0012FF2A09|nr:hypothetical protein [Streptomyces sp. Root1310]
MPSPGQLRSDHHRKLLLGLQVNQPGRAQCPLREHCVGKPLEADLHSQASSEEDDGQVTP